MSAVFGMGNPLLDISADVDQACLDKYGVTMNNAILAEEKQMPLYKDLTDNHQVQYIAGGATQNTIRVCQWMMQKEGATGFTGAVGNDKEGEQLATCAGSDGVAVHYAKKDSVPTGVCACLIKDKERSLVTNLQAANEYKIDDLNSESIKAAWTQSQIYYSSGFFLTVSPDSAVAVAKHASENKKTYCINLAAPFICQFFSKPLLEVIALADFVFGNESEAEAFGKMMEYKDCSPANVAKKIAAIEGKKRTVVITQGSDSTIVVKNGEMTTFTVNKVESSEIVDTNGAGDAFVGGFLSQLASGKDTKACVEAGHYSAGVIIKTSGTTLPKDAPGKY